MTSKGVTFIFEGEDHTLGNLLRMHMLQDDDVLYAGYKVPHPLTKSVEISVIPNKNEPLKTLVNAADNALNELANFEAAFNDN